MGATGYRRSWTDNLLWHHLGHLVDFALWMSGAEPAKVSGAMSPPDERTGTPMNAAILIETGDNRLLTIVGSYAGHDAICDTMVLTDRETYRIDAMANRLTVGDRTVQLQTEEADCAAALRDFLAAVRHDREPDIPGRSALPMMAALQQIQDEWDRRYGARPVPGRGGQRQ
jgi:2-hydroxy-4-carboxymuconate semialdehyde hemiacetal dehydrogenase